MSTKNNKRRYYLVCKKSLFGSLKIVKGFWNYTAATQYCSNNKGNFVILRQVESEELEKVWPTEKA